MYSKNAFLLSSKITKTVTQQLAVVHCQFTFNTEMEGGRKVKLKKQT